jgi:2,4-dienoyl-CoA reductase (NADPH2)
MVTGGMAPNREGGVFPGAAGLYTAADIANHRIVTDRVHDAGGRIAMQILHAGRYAYGKDCVSASAVKSPISPFVPRELDEDGIEKQIADIVTAAVRAREAGYDGVEVMGSEGYFLNQFLVTHTNRRTDRWGGAYENRMRLPVEVVRAGARGGGADFILIYRISLIDLVPDGSTWDEVVLLAKAVEAAGATLINTGIGWHEARVPTIATSVPRAAFAWLTARLRPEVGIPVIASNRINTPEVAEGLLARGLRRHGVDGAALSGRCGFRRQGRDGAGGGNRALHRLQPGLSGPYLLGRLTSCLVNPRACHETELVYAPRATWRGGRRGGRRAGGADVRAGRGGARAFRDAVRQGGALGGQLNLARGCRGRRNSTGWWTGSRGRSPARGSSCGWVGRQGRGPDRVRRGVVATGVVPRDPGLPGQDGPNVRGYAEVLAGAPVGQRVAVVGAGGIGFDVAEFLCIRAKARRRPPALWQREWGVGDPADNPRRAGRRRSAPEAARAAGDAAAAQARKAGQGSGQDHRLDPPRQPCDEGVRCGRRQL